MSKNCLEECNDSFFNHGITPNKAAWAPQEWGFHYVSSLKCSIQAILCRSLHACQFYMFLLHTVRECLRAYADEFWTCKLPIPTGNFQPKEGTCSSWDTYWSHHIVNTACLDFKKIIVKPGDCDCAFGIGCWPTRHRWKRVQLLNARVQTLCREQRLDTGTLQVQTCEQQDCKGFMSTAATRL